LLLGTTVRVIMGMSGLLPRQSLPWKGHDMTPPPKPLYRPGYDACSLCGHEKRKASRICGICRYARPSVVQPDDPFTRLIPLTQGQFAIVWTCCYDWLMQWKWFAWWCKYTRSFYAVRNAPHPNFPGKQISVKMHREILGLRMGDKREGDHALHNTLDNRLIVDGKINLRIAEVGENRRNRRRPINSSTGLKGASPVYTCHGGKKYFGGWKAQLQVDGKHIYLGVFPTPEQAHEAYKEAARLYHKDFAYWEG
jgi:hypothetical protein